MQLSPEFALLQFDSIDSTNNYAKKLALEGAKEKTVIISDKQTAGRGQVGRAFFSPKDSGLYMSIILRPEFDFSCFPLITTAAAVAVSGALDEFTDTKTKIKWVNDIYINDKKVCGILTETATLGETTKPFAVLGIGINLTKPKNDFPDEIKNIAGYVFESDDNLSNRREELAEEILSRFFKLYKDIPKKQFLDEYKKKSLLLGKGVSFECEGGTLSGTAIDIDQDANLIIETDKGIITLSCGRASVKLDEK